MEILGTEWTKAKFYRKDSYDGKELKNSQEPKIRAVGHLNDVIFQNGGYFVLILHNPHRYLSKKLQ